MNTARLRHTFRYANDNGDDSEPEAMDEQEQEDLIRKLADRNRRDNERFRRLLVALPLFAMLPFLLACLWPAASTPLSAAPARSPSLVLWLGLSSLAATAVLLHRLPPAQTGIAALDAWSTGGSTPSPPVSSFSASSPLEKYLPLLNFGLCSMILLSLLLPPSAAASANGGFTHLLFVTLPVTVYALSLAAKVFMASVDPERELNQLRYEYKGA